MITEDQVIAILEKAGRNEPHCLKFYDSDMEDGCYFIDVVYHPDDGPEAWCTWCDDCADWLPTYRWTNYDADAVELDD